MTRISSPRTGRVSPRWARLPGRNTRPGRAGPGPPPPSGAWSDQRLQSDKSNCYPFTQKHRLIPSNYNYYIILNILQRKLGQFHDSLTTYNEMVLPRSLFSISSILKELFYYEKMFFFVKINSPFVCIRIDFWPSHSGPVR